MQFRKKLLFLFLFVPLFSYGQTQQKDNLFQYSGRVEQQAGNVILIGPASSVSFDFSGDDCAILLASISNYNYVGLELDGVYIGRLRIETGPKEYPIAISGKNKIHHLSIYKATEANIGNIVFSGTSAKVITPKNNTKKRRKIEFIGDSLICGQGNDTTEIPCGQGNWFDQHNAYWSYAAISGRTLGVEFILNSYSGIGMYRNWNTESDAKQSMPDVYESLYFNKDMTKPYDFSFKPDIISIGIGNNDYFEGNGNPSRRPFEPQKFIAAYIGFLQVLYSHNPNTDVVLVSAILEGKNAAEMDNCLEKIKVAFKDKKILIFKFKDIKLHGCVSHPSKNDAEVMAAQYVDFMKNRSGLKR